MARIALTAPTLAWRATSTSRISCADFSTAARLATLVWADSVNFRSLVAFFS